VHGTIFKLFDFGNLVVSRVHGIGRGRGLGHEGRGRSIVSGRSGFRG
jgi:hypothetical protein